VQDFTGGNTSAWEKFSRAGRTYDFSQIHEDNHYKHPGARAITKMETGQPESQNLAWGRAHFQSRIKEMFASTMCLKSCLYPHFGNDEWLLS
jgi:hypothetical protein